MLTTLSHAAKRLELSLAGPLSPGVRRNMITELWVSIAYGIFYAAAVGFLPVVLRRMGATSDLLAIYTSQLFVGSALASLSIVVMRRRRTMSFIGACWLVGRALFLAAAFISQALWMVVLSGLFWLLEVFPGPGYTRVVQSMYPVSVRGKIMSTVRMGRVAAILLVTPLAGWALDHWGYRILFPVAGLAGMLSALLFLRLRVNEGPLPPRQTRTFSELRQIVQRDRRFSFYLFSFAIFGTGALLAWPFYPIIQVDRLHLSYSQIGLLGLAQSICWLVGYLYWGRQVDKRGGLWVLRATSAINLVLPLTYVFAHSSWMLIPAFMAQGITMAGWDMGSINAGIQLADPEKVTEYAAIQSTAVGVRGVIVPLVGAGLVRLGLPINGIFVLSFGLIILAWILFGRVDAPTPDQSEFEQRQELRNRWPLRFRIPRF